MKKGFLLLTAAALLMAACSVKTPHSITSPDGRVSVEVSLDDAGKPFYAVAFDGKPVMNRSQLGLVGQEGLNLSEGFKATGIKDGCFDETWRQPWGENKVVRNNYNETAVSLRNDAGTKLTIRFRVYDDGLGFRYEYDAPVDSVEVMDELTRFDFARDGKSWTIHSSFDTYEILYKEQPISRVENANTPATFRTEDGIYLSIHEAALTDFPEMNLFKEGERSFKAGLAPWPNGVKAYKAGKFTTPWRTLQISPEAVGLINSNLIINLNEPCALETTDWIRPMKYIGVWWGMHLGVNSWSMGPRHGATTQEAMKYIDFAASNNIQGVLFEGWNEGWDTWGGAQRFNFTKPYADFDLDAIVKYADSKGVAIIGHHETGGSVKYYESVLDEAIKWYTDHGVHNLKTGYAGGFPDRQVHHGQFGVRHYRNVVKTAAKYKMTVNAHEPIKPTGIRRTYPNMMTREGVRGMEWNAWSEGNPPVHHVILPFTRQLAGPMDYTPGIFDILYENTWNSPDRVWWQGGGERKTRVNTTLAKQIALWVVLYSPMQMASDLVENYERHPAFQFFRDFDTDCDFSRALQGEPGEFVAIVRRAGGKYFLGAVTNDDARELSVPLDWLEEGKTYEAVIYSDGPQADWKTNPTAFEITRREVTSADVLNLKLASGGGAAVTFIPQEIVTCSDKAE